MTIIFIEFKKIFHFSNTYQFINHFSRYTFYLRFKFRIGFVTPFPLRILNCFLFYKPKLTGIYTHMPLTVYNQCVQHFYSLFSTRFPNIQVQKSICIINIQQEQLYYIFTFYIHARLRLLCIVSFGGVCLDAT